MLRRVGIKMILINSNVRSPFFVASRWLQLIYQYYTSRGKKTRYNSFISTYNQFESDSRSLRVTVNDTPHLLPEYSLAKYATCIKVQNSRATMKLEHPLDRILWSIDRCWLGMFMHLWHLKVYYKILMIRCIKNEFFNSKILTFLRYQGSMTDQEPVLPTGFTRVKKEKRRHVDQRFVSPFLSL